MTDETIDETTGELVPLSQAPSTTRTVDLRDRATDSWTDILSDVVALSRGIANTEFVPKSLRGSVEKVSAAVLYSRELGLPPMTGLGGTHVIEGKAGISAELMRALVLQAGHELAIKESTRTRCEIWGRRKGSDEWTKSVWTIQEAAQTQVFVSKEKGWGPLSEKSQWKSWPTEMLLARATTRLVRMIFPDVAHGMRTVEELQDMQTEEVVEGEVVESQPKAQPVRRRRVARPAPKPQTDQSAAEASAERVEDEEQPEPPAAAPEPVQRKRPERPAPRATAPKPEPQPEAEPAVAAQVDTLPEADDEPVDAEIVDEKPDEMPKWQAQGLKVAHMHYQRLGVADRAEQLYYAGEITGHKVTSHKELTAEELRDLTSLLERSRDLAAVNAALDEKRQGDARG